MYKRQLLDGIENGKIIAIWGGGKHTCYFYRFLRQENKDKIAYIIDNNVKMHSDPYGFGKTYIGKNENVFGNIDTIIVSSFDQRFHIIEEIEALGTKAGIIDVYDELKRADIDIKIPFFFDVNYSYKNIMDALRDLESTTQDCMGNIMVKRLIGEYLHIRDMKNAFWWIDKLPEDDEDKIYYLGIRNNIRELLDRMSKNISGKKHIVVNWIDAMMPDEIMNMPFLEKQLSSGINFTNAHCIAAFTQATMKAIFTGKMHLDDGLYKMNVNELEDAELAQILKNNEYEFKYFGMPYFCSLFFNNRTAYVWHLAAGNYRNCASPVLQWEAVREMEESDKSCFVLIHNILETHYPFANGVQADLVLYESEDFWGIRADSDTQEWNKIWAQVKQSQHYFDEQLQFYNSIYKDIRYQIYLSDHGLYRCEGADNLERFTHVLFGIVGENVKPKTEDGMFSLISFPSVVKKILSDRTEHIHEDVMPYIFVQDEDGYHDSILRCFYINKELSENRYIQQKGIITTQDSYYRTVTGKEFYFQRQRKGNQANNEQFRERIQQLKDILGNKFVDIRKEDKYVNTRKIYELFGYKVSDDLEFM